MDFITLLAQTVDNANAAGPTPQQQLLNDIWTHITTLDMVEALTFISFGVVCLFYGWKVFRILVTICFALVGLMVGVMANKHLVGGNVIWLSIMLVIFFAFMSIPLMRWGVSILGAVAGGVLTGGLWLATGLPEQYVWAGGLIGVVAGGMLSFVIFKAAVILFTSLGGSGLVAIGALSVIYKCTDAVQFQNLAQNQKWFLIALLLVPLIAGILMQYRLIKQSKDWDE